MLECTGCHCRFVVRDFFLIPVEPKPPGTDGRYRGPDLPHRYACIRGCTNRLDLLASMLGPDDDTMWLSEPRIPVPLSAAIRSEWHHLIDNPSHWVSTPFPRDAILADYHGRHPVLTMTDHDGARCKQPDVRQALEWFDVMEHGQTLSFERRDGGTLHLGHDGETYSARLLESPNVSVEVSGLGRGVAEQAIERYITDAGIAGARELLEGAPDRT